MVGLFAFRRSKQFRLYSSAQNVQNDKALCLILPLTNDFEFSKTKFWPSCPVSERFCPVFEWSGFQMVRPFENRPLKSPDFEWIQNSKGRFQIFAQITASGHTVKVLSTKILSVSTMEWFKSFLSNRVQRCKIEESLSQIITINSGVPQGGILSPLLYIIYVADLMLWLRWSVQTISFDHRSNHKSLNNGTLYFPLLFL